MDQLQLRVLIFGHQPLQRHRAGNLRQARDALGDRLRCGEIRRHDLHRIGSGLGISPELEKSRDRFHLRAAQVHGIEVERQEHQERRAERDHEHGEHHYRNAMPLQKPVDRSEPEKAHRVQLAGRVEDRQQRR